MDQWRWRILAVGGGLWRWPFLVEADVAVSRWAIHPRAASSISGVAGAAWILDFGRGNRHINFGRGKDDMIFGWAGLHQFWA